MTKRRIKSEPNFAATTKSAFDDYALREWTMMYERICWM